MRDDPPTKRSKAIPDTSYDEIFNKMKSPSRVETSYQDNLPDNSRLSMPKNPEAEWDPNLEEDESSENSEVDKVEKAIELLYKNGLLVPVLFREKNLTYLGLFGTF